MASSGATAWSKYFQGKGNIETTMKKASAVFDPKTPTKKIGDVAAGTAVTYLTAKSFEAKALVQYKNGTKNVMGRVTFDSIAKPGVKASGAISLKPQAFNVGETKYSFTQYKTTVMDSISERKNLSPQLKTYLAALFDHYSGGSVTKDQVTKIFKKVKDDLPMNDINKDFGEVLGPVAVIQQKLLSSNKITLSKSTSKIYVPARPNEPLMDYALIDGTKQYTISAKSGTTTNVVKPPDILNLIAKDPTTLKKWKSTKEYKLLELLANNSILLGPIKAVSEIYPNLISKRAAETATAQSYDLAGFAGFINQNEYLQSKKKPTLNEIMYECEKMIMNRTKSRELDMNGIFSDAIKSKVLYVKFEVDNSTGLGKWNVIASSDIKDFKTYGIVYLRSKNGYTRASDRMGVQV
jgi:hypothetical protein